jgi:hypothetical protein
MADKPKQPSETETEQPGLAEVKRRTYQRQKLKKQVTVRIDEDICKSVLAQAESEGLRLTDAIEEGLWLWLQRKRRKGVALRGRFLWNIIPLDLQKLTLSFWSFWSAERGRPIDDAYRKGISDFLWAFRDDPEYTPGLEKLGELPGEDAEA